MSLTAAGLTATALSFLVFATLAVWYVGPWMRSRPLAIALRSRPARTAGGNSAVTGRRLTLKGVPSRAWRTLVVSAVLAVGANWAVGHTHGVSESELRQAFAEGWSIEVPEPHPAVIGAGTGAARSARLARTGPSDAGRGRE